MRPRLWPAEVIRAFETVRAERASRFRVLTGFSVTFATARSDGQFSRSHFGAENGETERERMGRELETGHGQ